jgi:hypothetical protein
VDVLTHAILCHVPPVTNAGLEPGQMLSNIFQQVPELGTFANLDLQVCLWD